MSSVSHAKYPYLIETGAQDRKSVWAQADEITFTSPLSANAGCSSVETPP
eukprot:gene26582-biopygen16929